MNKINRHPSQRISLVVLTYNRASEIVATLERLLALPEEPPIYLADNGSTDDTVRTVRSRFPSVRIVECGANLGAAGRNCAVAGVRTEYVAFCDDDTWWEPGSLTRAIELLDTWPSVGILSARVVVGPERRTDPTCALMSQSPLSRDALPGPALVGFLAGASVFRTALFREVGGYQTKFFIGGEEELVALDVLASHHAIVYCDQLTVHHHPSASRNSRLRRRLLARNAAWVACLRLPWPLVLQATVHALRTFWREGTFIRDSAEFASGAAWAFMRRKPVEARVRQMLDCVRDAGQTEAASNPARVRPNTTSVDT
jgi:GT2 family glycosyltransferase